MKEFYIPSYSSTLKLAEDGIWHSSENASLSYPSEGNTNCFAVEDNSFWFNHRNNCIRELLQAFPPPQKRLFDIGGGNGCVAANLTKAGFEVALVEPGLQGAINAKKRNLKNVICSTIDQAHFKTGSIPAIGLFDVIEHIENDLDFLKKIFALIQPEGFIYISVPAYKFLWSAEDTYAGHYRRYTKSNLQNLVKNAGFEVVYSTYFFRLLILPILFLRALPYRLKKHAPINQNVSSDHGNNMNGLMKKIINSIFTSELKPIRNGTSISFGASILLVAKKP